VCASQSLPRVQRAVDHLSSTNRHVTGPAAKQRPNIHRNRQQDRAQKPVNISVNIKMERQSLRKRKLGSTRDRSPGKGRSDHESMAKAQTLDKLMSGEVSVPDRAAKRSDHRTHSAERQRAPRHGRDRRKPHERLDTLYYDSVLLCVVSFRWFYAVRSMCARVSLPRVQRAVDHLSSTNRHATGPAAKERANIHRNRQQDRAQKPVNISVNIKMERQSLRKRRGTKQESELKYSSPPRR
jgi:hypothetical protein